MLTRLLEIISQYVQISKCMPETNAGLYVIYTSLKKKEKDLEEEK